MTIQTDIKRALWKHGITPEAPLVNLHPTSNIWSDQKTLVVKIGSKSTRYSYLHDLGVFIAAGVRCERPLIDDVVGIGDRFGVVVSYLKPDRATRASDAEAVGALLREIHEATLASELYEPCAPGEVFFPDDWLAQNILVHEGAPYLVDLDMWSEWKRDEAVDQMCWDFLKQLPHTDDDAAAFRRGYGEFA